MLFLVQEGGTFLGTTHSVVLTQVRKKLNKMTSKKQVHSKIINCILNVIPHCLKWITQHSEVINKSAKDIVFVREGQKEIILGLQKSPPHFTSPCGFSPVTSQVWDDIIQIK